MAYTDSDSATVVLPLRGVWLHDPADASDTLTQFPYGDANHDDAYDAMGVGTYFVGRSDPVFDYGDPSSFVVNVTVDVLHGEDYLANLQKLRDFAAVKKELWYRDNRGRALYGTMSGFKVTDQRWGSAVAFTFTQAYRVVTEVSA